MVGRAIFGSETEVNYGAGKSRPAEADGGEGNSGVS